MADITLASTLLDNAVTELSRLPGLGRRTALRLALHILRQEPQMADALGNAIVDMRHGVKYCPQCHNISDTDELCPICANPRRDSSTICVVESIKDVMSIENTGQYHGLYHVLGGVISPMDGLGPDQLEISSLAQRASVPGIREIILALPATIEGETTDYYIYRRLAALDVKVTQLARGVQVGNQLEYTDEITLGRSIVNRTLFGQQTI